MNGLGSLPRFGTTQCRSIVPAISQQRSATTRIRKQQTRETRIKQMSQGLCPSCGATVTMNADHDGDICTECGATVKFRVQAANGRLVFLAGALELFTIEPNEINAYDKTCENFGKLAPRQLNEVLSAIEKEIVAAGEGTGHARRLKESRRAVQDLIAARNQTP